MTAMSRAVRILLVDDDPAEYLILQAMVRKVTSLAIQLDYCETIDAALQFLHAGNHVSMVLLDNRLQPQIDFRQTVPALRKQGYIGPVGIISSSLSAPYFQKLEEYGADFRIDKSEIDPTALEFIIREYTTAPLTPLI